MKNDLAQLLIGRSTPADVPAIAALLRAAELPSEDFASHVENFLVARSGSGAVVGAVGAERTCEAALLRSLVVEASLRGRGLGGRLVDELERSAEAWGVRQWWLLTATAGAFFASRGFRVAERCAAPAGIRATRQFSGGCGDDAVCMTRECQGGAGKGGR